MPFIHLPSHDDYVAIWYTTNSPYGNVGSFDSEKPTVVILHPTFLDSSWLGKHFDDPRLSSQYNIIAFDHRNQGRSRCRPSALHDVYVDAADIASAIQSLFLPPAHFLAFECISVNTALRLAALWPELVLSLTLCNVPPPTEVKRVFNAYDELLKTWCYAPDLDSFEHAGSEVITLLVGNTDDSDLLDGLIAFWEKTSPPGKRLRCVELMNILMNRTAIGKKELARIQCPVLIIQIENNYSAPLKYAESLRDDIKDATGIEPRVYMLRGSITYVSLFVGSASIVNRIFDLFLSQLPRSRSDLCPPAIPGLERTRLALQTLSELVGDPSIALRNPKSLLSFSCVTPEVAKGQLENLRFYAKDIDQCYCPLGRDGRPIRKYSERLQACHWFHGDSQGMSHVDPEVVIAARRYVKTRPPEKPLPGSLIANGDDLLTESLAHDGSVRRIMVNSSTVEKQTIKGSMSKVITQGNSLKGGFM